MAESAREASGYDEGNFEKLEQVGVCVRISKEAITSTDEHK